MPEEKQEKQEQVTWLRCRLPTFTQMGIGAALVAIAFRHVLDTDYKFPTVNTLERRVAFTLRCLAISIVPLVGALATMSFGRLLSAAINPFSGNEKMLEIPARILQNTLEQFVLHSFILLALSTLVTNAEVKFIPFLAILFVVARILFIVGYNIKQSHRALGFFMTFMPTMVTIATVLVLIYKRGMTTF